LVYCKINQVFESEEKAIEIYKKSLREYEKLAYSHVSYLLNKNGMSVKEKEKNLLDNIIQRIDIQNNITFSSGKNTTLLNLAYCQSELGELATEVLTSLGHGGKEAGKDGIFGESVDLIITAIAIMLSTNPNITSQDILDKLDEKVKKCESKNKQNSEDTN
jgi:phosphoribosyl-ATP pyrophosphohydrolase